MMATKSIKEKLLDITTSSEKSAETNNPIIWHDFVINNDDELKIAEENFKRNKDNNCTDKQAVSMTILLIKRRRKAIERIAKENERAKIAKEKEEARIVKENERAKIAKEKEEARIVKENERRFKELEKIKSINYNIMYYESLGLEVNSNTGLPTQNAGNYKALLLNKSKIPHTFKWNEFTECIEMDDRQLKDNDITLLYNKFSNIAGFESDRKLRGAIVEVALDNSYHPVKQYLENLEWDGISRVETMFTTFLSAKDCELYRTYAKLFMIAAIKRVYKPGCKFDNMLVLQGEQGNGKSTFCEKLAVNDKWYNDNITIADRDKDSLLYMQDAWIVIMDELDAWNKADSNAAKGFMSKRSDKFRAPYAQNSEEHPRHCVFIGNTNDETFLKDSTAITERRYWVIKTEGNWETSRDKIKSMTPEMIDQLWAEAMIMYKENEDIELVIPPELYKTMVNEQLQFKNENGCDQYDFLEDILNREYSPTVFDNINNLYNEYENKVIIEDKTLLTKKDYFPIASLKYLFEKERWFFKKNTFTMFAKWSQTDIWSGSKWKNNKITRNNKTFQSLIRTDQTYEETTRKNDDENQDNEVVKISNISKKYLQNSEKTDEKNEKTIKNDVFIKISGNDLFE